MTCLIRGEGWSRDIPVARHQQGQPTNPTCNSRGCSEPHQRVNLAQGFINPTQGFITLHPPGIPPLPELPAAPKPLCFRAVPGISYPNHPSPRQSSLALLFGAGGLLCFVTPQQPNSAKLLVIVTNVPFASHHPDAALQQPPRILGHPSLCRDVPNPPFRQAEAWM